MDLTIKEINERMEIECEKIREDLKKKGEPFTIKKTMASTGRLMITISFLKKINMNAGTKLKPNIVELDYHTIKISEDLSSSCVGTDRCYYKENRGYYCSKHRINPPKKQ